MSYWVKAVLGLALFLAGLAAFDYSLYELVQIGTCASGGPYVPARPCPEGTFGKALLMPAGLIVGGIGIVLYALRGRRPGATGDRGGIGAGLIGWSGLFVSTGVVALLASIGPRKYAPVVAAMKGAAARPWAGRPQTARPATPSRPAGGDPVDRLRKLGELRDAGVSSAAEFDTAKARILAEL